MTSENKHFSKNDRIFYSDGYQLAQIAIDKGISNETLFEAIEQLYEAIDTLNNSITAFSIRQNNEIECRKGCEWCCHQAVYANSYELHYLSEKLKEKFSDAEFLKVQERTSSKNSKTLTLTETEIGKYKSACPLLVDGACSVYKARPMACRIYLSNKVKSCIEFYQHPENESNYPALLEFPLRAGRMMNEGFRAALKEIGIETKEFRLEEGLHILLNNPAHKIN